MTARMVAGVGDVDTMALRVHAVRESLTRISHYAFGTVLDVTRALAGGVPAEVWAAHRTVRELVLPKSLEYDRALVARMLAEVGENHPGWTA